MDPDTTLDTGSFCVHEPDWHSMARADINSEDGLPVFDVACQHCGQSGSFILSEVEIQWD